MGLTCEQGKPNGNQKKKQEDMILGRRLSKKQRLTQLKEGALAALQSQK